jgi:hypothetical protein
MLFFVLLGAAVIIAGDLLSDWLHDWFDINP